MSQPTIRRRLNDRELTATLRQTQLKGHDQHRIYAKARISLARVQIADLKPCQRYTIRETVDTLRDLAELFDHYYGIDIFNLNGAVFFNSPSTGGEQIPIIPPICEVSEPDGGITLINDGMHRIAAARELGRTEMTVIEVEDLDPKYPYYAFPLENGWDDVISIDSEADLKPGFVKKTYRVEPGYKDLFRLFNDVLPGVQKDRKKVR